MKYMIVMALVIMSTPLMAHDHQPINVDCQKMAENARGFAELKQGGIATTPTQLEKFVVNPTVESYPVQSLLDYVMNAPNQDPTVIYNNLYNKCTIMGYKELFTYFSEREDVSRLDVALAQRDTLIGQLRDQIAQLQQQNTALKYPKKHWRHGARVVVEDVSK